MLKFSWYGESIRETVKTILLEQDPPYHKNDGGLFLYPPTPTSKDGVLAI